MNNNNSIFADIRAAVASGNPVNVIIFINVCVFLFLLTVRIIDVLFFTQANGALFGPVAEQVLLRDDWFSLLTHPWTLFTHMFAHEGVFHILFNMMFLYWFGHIVRQYSGNRHIWPLYIYGGLSSAFLIIVFYNVFPGLQSRIPFVQALGASGSVNAIVLAAATLVPNLAIRLPFLGDVKLKWIAVFMVLLNYAALASMNPIGGIGHLGGALLGFVYIRQLRVGHDFSNPFYTVTDFFQGLYQRIFKGKRPRLVYKRQKGEEKLSKAEMDRKRQDRINVILDKISKSGYDSLSKEEKAFLFRVSKEEDK